MIRYKHDIQGRDMQAKPSGEQNMTANVLCKKCFENIPIIRLVLIHYDKVG